MAPLTHLEATVARGFSYAPGASDEVVLAQSSELARDRVIALAGGRNAVVRETVAGRPDLPLGTMVALAHDRSADVRAAIASNPHATPSVLEHLACDRQPAVLHGLLDNPALEPELAARLASHRREDVRDHAARRLATSSGGESDRDHATPELRERGGSADGALPGRAMTSLYEDRPAPTRTAPVRGFLPPTMEEPDGGSDARPVPGS